MSVFRHLKYQLAVAEIFESRKTAGETKWTLRRLAEHAGMQPSFLTNVLKERFDFNTDQLFAVCSAMDVTKPERNYLQLLLEYQRSTNRARRAELKSEIDAIRRAELTTEKHTSVKAHLPNTEYLSEYYLDPFVQLAHVHLEVSPYDRDPAKLTSALGISPEHLNRIIDVLTRMGVIRRKGAGIEVIGEHRHLPKENPLCGPHQALIRMRSIDQLSRLGDDEKYSFSVTLSGTSETRAELQREFLAFLNKAERLVKAAKAEEVFQMNFDLFNWRV